MKFIVFAILLHLHPSGQDAQIRKDSITLFEGDTLQNYFTFDTIVSIYRCEVSFLENNLTVTTTINLVKSHTSATSEMSLSDISSRITPLYRNICGFTISNYAATDPEYFTLVVYYTENNESLVESETFEVNVHDKQYETIRNTTMMVALGLVGNAYRVSCGDEIDVMHCSLYHPSGRLMAPSTNYDCNYEFKNPIIIEDIGTWKCVMSKRTSMRQSIVYKTLVLTVPAEIISWHRTLNGYGHIGCQYIRNDDQTNPNDCQLRRPDKQSLVISSVAGVTERYTTPGTNFSNSYFQIEFPLPIQPNEIGPWQCLINNQIIYFMVNYEPKTNPQPTRYRRIVQLEEKVIIICEVNYSSDDCYISSPLGVIYSGGTRVKDFVAGNCSHTIEKIIETDFGEWQCHFAHPVESQYERVIVELVQMDKFEVITHSVLINSGDTLVLLCRAQIPIVHCSFIDSHWNTYDVIPDREMPDYEYYGQGFSNGECGIAINKAKMEDTGEWQCLVRLNTKDPTLRLKLYSRKLDVVVNPKGLSLIAIVGITVGIVIVITVVIGSIAYRKWQKKKRQASEGQVNAQTPLNDIPRNITINDETRVSFI